MAIEIGQIRLVCFPEHDMSFRECVQGLIDLTSPRATERSAALKQVQRTTRQRYPSAVIREKRGRQPSEMVTWQAYRDGRNASTAAHVAPTEARNPTTELEGHWFG